MELNVNSNISISSKEDIIKHFNMILDFTYDDVIDNKYVYIY